MLYACIPFSMYMCNMALVLVLCMVLLVLLLLYCR